MQIETCLALFAVMRCDIFCINAKNECILRNIAMYTMIMTEHVVLPNGDQEWRKNGKRHRDGDQPAEIWADGTQLWYQDGKRLSDDRVISLQREALLQRNLTRAHIVRTVHANRDVSGVICSYAV